MQILRNFFKFDVKLDTIFSFLDKNTDQNASAPAKKSQPDNSTAGRLAGKLGAERGALYFFSSGAGPSAGRGFAAVYAAQTELVGVGVTVVAICALHRANANKGRKRKKSRFYR